MNNKSYSKIVRDAVSGAYELSILEVLPKPKEKKLGILRKNIAHKIYMKPEKLSVVLQKMKKDGKVRCYKGRWRQA